LITYVSGDLSLSNYVQYYFDLEESNQLGSPLWKELYNFTSAYNKKDLSTMNLQHLVKEMSSDDTIFEKHLFFNTNGHSLGKLKVLMHCMFKVELILVN